MIVNKKKSSLNVFSSGFCVNKDIAVPGRESYNVAQKSNKASTVISTQWYSSLWQPVTKVPETIRYGTKKDASNSFHSASTIRQFSTFYFMLGIQPLLTFNLKIFCLINHWTGYYVSYWWFSNNNESDKILIFCEDFPKSV